MCEPLKLEMSWKYISKRYFCKISDSQMVFRGTLEYNEKSQGFCEIISWHKSISFGVFATKILTISLGFQKLLGFHGSGDNKV